MEVHSKCTRTHPPSRVSSDSTLTLVPLTETLSTEMYRLTDSFIKEIEDFGIVRPAVDVLGDGQDLVDRPGLDVPERVGLLHGERRHWLKDWDEDLLPGAGQLLKVLRLGERQALE